MNEGIPVLAVVSLSFWCHAAEPDLTSAVPPAEPRSKVEWEKMLSGIHAGLSRPSVHRMLTAMGKERRVQWSPPEERRPHDLYWLARDGSWRLHVTYTTDWAVESFEVFQPDIADLRARLADNLFAYVTILHGSADPHGGGYDPVKLIRTVNGLIPLRKDVVLDAMSEYNRLCQDMTLKITYDLDEQRMFLVLRLLFARGDGDPMMPAMHFDVPDIRPDDSDKGDWPLFPLALVNDIPFLLTRCMSTNTARSAVEHIVYCRKHCVLRTRPLAPSACPVAAVERLLGSAGWKRLAERGHRGLVLGIEQVEDLVRMQGYSALGPIHEFRGWGCNENPRWQENARTVKDLGVRWDAEKQVFVAGTRPK